MRKAHVGEGSGARAGAVGEREHSRGGAAVRARHSDAPLRSPGRKVRTLSVPPLLQRLTPRNGGLQVVISLSFCLYFAIFLQIGSTIHFSHFFITFINEFLSISPFRLNDGGLLISFEGSSYTCYATEELQSYRVIVGNRVCTFLKESDPTILRATTSGTFHFYWFYRCRRIFPICIQIKFVN